MGNNNFSFTENVRNEAVAVGTSVVVLSERRSEKDRTAIVVRNTSPNATDIITVSFAVDNAPIVANNGIVLRQFESFTDADDNGYKAYQGKMLAICATATGQLSVLER